MDTTLIPPSPSPSVAASLPSASEVDSLSDSDWLDIASSRESEDNDSIIEHEEVGDDHGSHRSRRSSVSIDSGSDAFIERWEGLIEDSDDENAIRERVQTFVSASAADLPPASPIRDVPLAQDDPIEDQRVKAALDQSMISTLSSSRSSASGPRAQSPIHASRDLRLSFPDPLSHSQDDLNRSYDDVSPSEVEPSTEAETPFTDVTMTVDDLGSHATPEVPQVQSSVDDPDFNIVLYGFSSANKLSFVDTILEKAGSAAGLALSAPVSGVSRVSMRILRDESVRHVVGVIDMTASRNAESPSMESSPDRPSLAILYLPSPLGAVAEHTFYLPVLVPPSSIINSFSEEIERHAAQNRWDLLGIPSSKVLPLKRNSPSSIIDQEELNHLDTSHIYRSLQPLLSPQRRKPVKSLRDQVTPVHLMTVLVFLLSVIIGYNVNEMRRSNIPLPTRTQGETVPTSVSSLGALPNQSISAPAVVLDGINAIVPLSVKDFALAVFHPGAAPPSTVSQGSRQVRTYTRSPGTDESKFASSSKCECRSLLGPGEKLSSTDMILRPLPPSPALRGDSRSKALSIISPSHKGKGKAVASAKEEYVTSLSLRLIGSLSEIFDVQALLEGMRRDMKELMDALDELMRAISRQADLVAEQSRNTVEAVRSQFIDGHARAKERARRLKEYGESFMSSAGQQVVAHTGKARNQARALKDQMVALEAWNHNSREGRTLRRTAKREQRRDRRMRRERSNFKEFPLNMLGYVF